MKLICCVTCNQTFSLSRTYQECKGEHGGGQYVDNLNAKVWGPREKIFVLGFANSTFIGALRDQLHYGDQPQKYITGYGVTSPGREFTAFVIPDMAASVDRTEERFAPIDISNRIY